MILCCGDALIDMLPTQMADGKTAWVPCPGGAVFNTAIALGRLGVASGLLTGLSSDAFGEMLLHALTASKVDTSLAVMTDRKTTLAFVHLDAGDATYSFHDEGSAMRSLRIDDIPPLPDEVTTLFFGGISLASEPCATAMENLQTREFSDRITVLDPNVRPQFLSDEGLYRARIDRMIRRADIVKISDEDLAWLVPDDRSPELKMRAILALGPSLVVMTQGSQGARAMTVAGVDVSVRAQAVTVVDTVGAGDTLNAGFLAKLAEFGPLEDLRVETLGFQVLQAALEYGVAAAAYTVSQVGARPPRLEDLHRLA